MNIIKKLFLYLKYKNVDFLFLGTGSNYRQYNSRYLYANNISIGNYSKILDYALLDGVGGITIGECTIIGPKVTILTSNHNYHEQQAEFLPFDNIMLKQPVSIGDYCWLGMGVLVLPGVNIGKACVVGAGSVVTNNVDDYSVIGGNPARLLRKRDPAIVDQLIGNGRCVGNPLKNQTPTKIYR